MLLALAGLSAIGAVVTGAALNAGAVALAGGLGGSGAFSSLILYANAVRRDKVRTRLLEIALAKATTSDEVVKILREVFDRPGLFGRK